MATLSNPPGVDAGIYFYYFENQLQYFNVQNITVLGPGHLQLGVDNPYNMPWDQYYGTFPDYPNALTSGDVTRYQYIHGNNFVLWDLRDFSVPIVDLIRDVSTGNYVTALNRIFGGPDLMTGSSFPDELRSYGGNDTLYGGGGADTLDGGADQNYLRGDEGNDSISGGANFDDINGNMGNDTAHGNAGNDWVVGGKDQDLLFGDGGFDIVYGNMGDDTVSGGDGADWVRGGQGNDSVSGGAGDDWLWGDRGDDTISGGTGADIFHTFAGAGIDRITDFSLAEGDKVQIDGGAAYTLKQVGADAVVDMGNGDQLILVGIQASTLTGGWLIGA